MGHAQTELLGGVHDRRGHEVGEAQDRGRAVGSGEQRPRSFGDVGLDVVVDLHDHRRDPGLPEKRFRPSRPGAPGRRSSSRRRRRRSPSRAARRGFMVSMRSGGGPGPGRAGRRAASRGARRGARWTRRRTGSPSMNTSGGPALHQPVDRGVVARAAVDQGAVHRDVAGGDHALRPDRRQENDGHPGGGQLLRDRTEERGRHRVEECGADRLGEQHPDRPRRPAGQRPGRRLGDRRTRGPPRQPGSCGASPPRAGRGGRTRWTRSSGSRVRGRRSSAASLADTTTPPCSAPCGTG